MEKDKDIKLDNDNQTKISFKESYDAEEDKEILQENLKNNLSQKEEKIDKENDDINGVKVENDGEKEDLDNMDNKIEDLEVEPIKSNNLEYVVKGTGLTMAEMARLFGQSEQEMSREFGSYMACKLYGKMDYLIDDVTLAKDEFISKCLLAVKYGFKSVTVLPTFVAIAKNVLKNKNVAVRVLISSPIGEDVSKVKYYAVKKAIQAGADGIVVTVSISGAKSGEYKLIAKEIKKIIKISASRPVTVLIEQEYLSPLEIEGLSKTIVTNSRVYSIMPSSIYSDKLTDAKTIKDVYQTINGKCYADCGGKVKTSIEAISLMSAGANIVTSRFCPEIAEELGQKINSGS